MCVCVCVNGCSPFHVQRSEFYFSGHLSCFYVLEMNFAGAFGALQHQLLGRPGWGSLCQARQALPSLVGSCSLHFAVSLSHVAMSCVFLLGQAQGHQTWQFAQVLAVVAVVSPAALHNTWWEPASPGLLWCFGI